LNRCRIYLILIIKVKKDKLFPKALKSLEKLSTKIEYVDEEQRRIVANVLEDSLSNVIKIIEEFAEYASYEVKASCSLKDANSIKDKLKYKHKFKVVSRGHLNSFIGIYNNRLFNLEIKGKRIHIKVGNKYTGNYPPSPLPPTLFVFEYTKADEIKALINELKEFIKNVVKEV
jgi:hypothetical protein